MTGVTAAVVMGFGLLNPTVHAMIEDDLYAFNDEIELTDEELGGLRGRYVGGNQITYFGVEMYTQVANASGQTTTAGLSFSTDVSATGIRPTVTIYHTSSAGDGSAPATGNVASVNSAGVNNINGVSQSIQVAGDLNAASNDLGISISSDPGNPDSLFANVGGTRINLDGPGTQNILGDAGTSTTFSLNKTGFGYTVVLPGNIEVSQNVRNAALNQANGISQQVQISSDQYRVNNVINIVARQQQVIDGFQRPEISTALSSLRGLQSIGRL
jgi:hypothetical protein